MNVDRNNVHTQTCEVDTTLPPLTSRTWNDVVYETWEFNFMNHWSLGMWNSVWRPKRPLHINAKKCITIVSHQHKNIFKPFILPLVFARLTLHHNFTVLERLTTKQFFLVIRMLSATMCAAVHLGKWLWTLTISNDQQNTVKSTSYREVQTPRHEHTGRNGDEGEWPSSYSSEDNASHWMEGRQPKIMWRGTETYL